MSIAIRAVVCGVCLLSVTQQSAAFNVAFDPDGAAGGSGVLQVMGFDWESGNGLYLNTIPSEGTNSNPMTFYGHSRLANLIDSGGAAIPLPDLNSTYEITMVVAWTGTEIDAAGTSTYSQTGSLFYEVWWDDSPDANSLAGTGYNNGVEIASGVVSTASSQVSALPIAGPGPLDQNGPNNYPAISSVFGVGNSSYDVSVPAASQDSDFFVAGLPLPLAFVGNEELIFNSTDPSAKFTNQAGGVAPAQDGATLGSVGATNAVTGPNFMVQTDLSASVQGQGNPEQGASIHGFKFEDKDANGLYDPNVDAPFEGVSFEVSGFFKQPEVVVSDVAGQFWVTNLAPGDLLTIEEQEGSPELMPSTQTSQQLGIPNAFAYVWQGGASVGGQTEEVVGDTLMFGNFVKGSIHGLAFLDADKDGSYDPNTDTLLENIMFELNGQDGSGATVENLLVSSDDMGRYWITDLVPGQYTLTLRDDLSGLYMAAGGTVLDFTLLSRQEYVWQDNEANLDPNSLKVEVLDASFAFGLMEVPEPSTYVLLGTSLLAVSMRAGRRQSAGASS